DDAGIAQILDIGGGEIGGVDLHLAAVGGQLRGGGLDGRGRQRRLIARHDQGGAGTGQVLLGRVAGNEPDAARRGVQHFALERAEIGHGIGAFNRGAGAQSERGRQAEGREAGASRVRESSLVPGQSNTHATSLRYWRL